MKHRTIDLTPKNEAEAAIAAEENFRLDVQYAIIDAMEVTGITRTELASKLNIAADQVDQFFSDECNLSVRELGRIFHAIGCPLEICFNHT